MHEMQKKSLNFKQTYLFQYFWKKAYRYFDVRIWIENQYTFPILSLNKVEK